MFYRLTDNVLINLSRIEAVQRTGTDTETGNHRVVILMRSGEYLTYWLDIQEWDRLVRQLGEMIG